MKCLVCGSVRRLSGGPYAISGVAFHNFPANEERTKEWLKHIEKASNLVVTKNDGLCSEHFSDDQYEILPDLYEDSDPLSLKKPKLKRTAIPTLKEVFVRNFKVRKSSESSEFSSRPSSALSDHCYARPSSSLDSRPSISGNIETFHDDDFNEFQLEEVASEEPFSSTPISPVHNMDEKENEEDFEFEISHEDDEIERDNKEDPTFDPEETFTSSFGINDEFEK